jgi:hypothetical protein
LHTAHGHLSSRVKRGKPVAIALPLPAVYKCILFVALIDNKYIRKPKYLTAYG